MYEEYHKQKQECLQCTGKYKELGQSAECSGLWGMESGEEGNDRQCGWKARQLRRLPVTLSWTIARQQGTI